jgi:hypothetical protein
VLILVEDVGDRDDEILSYYADEANRGQTVTAAFLILLATLFFLWFLAILRGRLARAEGRAGPYTTVAFGAGLVAAALWLVADVLAVGIAYTVNENDDFALDPELHRLVGEIAYLLFAFGTPVVALLVVSTSLLGLKRDLVPKWLAWLGFPIAAFMIVSFLFVVPFVLFLLWVIAVSLVLIVRAGAGAHETG